MAEAEVSCSTVEKNATTVSAVVTTSIEFTIRNACGFYHNNLLIVSQGLEFGTACGKTPQGQLLASPQSYVITYALSCYTVTVQTIINFSK